MHKCIYFPNINVKRLFKTNNNNKKNLHFVTCRPFPLCICVAKLLVVFPYVMCFQKSILYKNYEETFRNSGRRHGPALFCLRWVFNDDDGCWVEMVWFFVIQSVVRGTVSEVTSCVWLSEELVVSLWLTESSSIVPVVSSNAWSLSAMKEKESLHYITPQINMYSNSFL